MLRTRVTSYMPAYLTTISPLSNLQNVFLRLESLSGRVLCLHVRWGGVLLVCLCRHRNLVTDTEDEESLGVSIAGPGAAHAELEDTDKGTIEVLCTARTAGDEVLSVFDLSSGISLFGSPYKVSPPPYHCLCSKIYL